jgi:hypothetical protein
MVLFSGGGGRGGSGSGVGLLGRRSMLFLLFGSPLRQILHFMCAHCRHWDVVQKCFDASASTSPQKLWPTFFKGAASDPEMDAI